MFMLENTIQMQIEIQTIKRIANFSELMNALH